MNEPFGNAEQLASLEQRAHDLFWALMQAPYADTTIGNIVCAETTPQRLESAWIPLLTAALANQQEGDINPSGPSFQAGYDTGHSEFQWLAGLVNNPVCERCGATSDADAETKCRPTDCSCPGTEFPLAQLWAIQRPQANQQGVGANAARYATYFRWLMRGKNLELAAALMAKDQYATLRRLCESLVPLDDTPTQPAGDVGRENG